MWRSGTPTHFWPWRSCRWVRSSSLWSPGSSNPAGDICSSAGWRPDRSSAGEPAEPSFSPQLDVDQPSRDVYVPCGDTDVQSQRTSVVVVWRRTLPWCLTCTKPSQKITSSFGFWNLIVVERRKVIRQQESIFSVCQVTPCSLWKEQRDRDTDVLRWSEDVD